MLFKWLRTADYLYAGRTDGRRLVMRDGIVDEIRTIREAYARRFNYDLSAIYEDLKRKQEESGREVVRLKPKRTKPERPTSGR